MTYSNELYHYGVLGQKWGVRRYQNYDGSYTQTGLKRYRKTAANYEYSKNQYKEAKANYKLGRTSKEDVKRAKQTMKEDRRTRDKYYKQLHKDYMADKGKDLYNRGKRITTRGQVFAQMAKGSAVAAVLLKSLASVSNSEDSAKLANWSNNFAIVSAGSGAAFGIVNAYAELPMGDNARMRAFYSHKHLPDVKEKGK